jgi:hypothetical protein
MLDINNIVSRIGWAGGLHAKLTRPFSSAILRRSYSTNSHVFKKIMLIYLEDNLATPMLNGFLRQTDRLRKFNIEVRGISYTEYIESPKFLEVDAIFFQAPYFLEKEFIGDQLKVLRSKNPSAIISFFDWSAPCDLRFSEYVEPWIDYYLKKSILKNPEEFENVSVGHTNLSDYFSRKFGTENPKRDWNVPSSIYRKLRVAPAFHTASSLLSIFEKPKDLDFDKRSIDLHSRIQVAGGGWYSAMRTHANEQVSKLDGKLNIVSSGRISHRKYMQELRSSKICFSPFGYGEICWRDFEAAATGAVLLKPDMAHLVVDPDIYRPYETYLPVRWDLSDFREKVALLMQDKQLRERLANNAFDVLHSHVMSDSTAELALELTKSPIQTDR